ncbi:MAG: hypothetical protein K1Y36_10550 [Blastocatellia bacterium]|nr:hypothetical protein [Blastocatellia bacterium]
MYHRRHFLFSWLGLPAFVSLKTVFPFTTQEPPPTAAEPRFTLPPETETETIAKLINQAETALKAEKTQVSALLTNPTYQAAHEWPRFRALIARYAIETATLVTPQEPGAPLLVTGMVQDNAGRPLAGALVYAYHTSAKGWYSDKAPHISGNSGDEKHARLFGYLKTNAKGQFEIRTIRPGGYPRSTLPQHIHIEIAPPGSQSMALVSEILFEDDPRLTAEMQEQSRRNGFVICPVTKDTNGTQLVKAEFRL